MSSPDSGRIVVDVGNTSIHWGLSLDGSVISQHGRFDDQSVSQFVLDLSEKLDHIPRIFVASVNPDLLALLNRTLVRVLGIETIPLVVGDNWHPHADVQAPSEVGIDRLLNARAFNDFHPKGGIVVDHGTALTIDYVASGGVYSGGVIVPGLSMAVHSLSHQTALISPVDFRIPDSVIGKNTSQCVSSGLYFGLAGLVEAVVKQMQQELDQELPVVVTGGRGSLFLKISPSSWHYEPLLTLRGLLKAIKDAQLG